MSVALLPEACTINQDISNEDERSVLLQALSTSFAGQLDEGVTHTAERDEGGQGGQRDVESANPKQEHLCQAIADNDVALVHALLQHGADPSKCHHCDCSSTPIQHAAENGLSTLAKVIVSAGADIEARTGEHGNTPLLSAIMSEHRETAVALLELGANPNARDKSGASALEMAVRCNDVRLVLALIKNGAFVDCMSANGWTPLHVAAGLDHPTAIAALVHFGADPDTCDSDGDTPLITACSLGYSDCVQQLLASGANPNIITQVPK